jgi:L-aspartate oxidase
MHKYHEMAELAPRDVVARAIAHELEITKRPDAVVYLDLTHLNSATVRKRFPTIYATCMRYNIDIADELVPIRPAAHYAMGGVRTDLECMAPIVWPAIPCWKAWFTVRGLLDRCETK